MVFKSKTIEFLPQNHNFLLIFYKKTTFFAKKLKKLNPFARNFDIFSNFEFKSQL
jgi:hypothetical protein